MKDDTIFRAIGNIDEDLIDRAAPAEGGHLKNKTVRATFAPWLKWATPLAACLVIAAVIAVPMLLKQPRTGNGNTTIAGAGNMESGSISKPQIGGNNGGEINSSAAGSAPGSAAVPHPSLSSDNGAESAACYAALEDWRGRLQTENYVLNEETNGSAADRMCFRYLDDLAAGSDAFVLIANVHEVSPDGDNMQSAIAEYAETIGDVLNIRQWDDRTVSTGSRVLIRQQLIGGCTMDEPNNLLRVGGVYVLPLTFYEFWGAYRVVGDLDVLFELDDTGRMVSHSRWESFNQYDGMTLPDFIEAVRGLYSQIDVNFIEKPINAVEQAKNQVIEAYNASGFRKFSVEFDSETLISGADAYLFRISFEHGSSEYAAIAKENGAFIRGEVESDGEFRTFGGLGGFPWNNE